MAITICLVLVAAPAASQEAFTDVQYILRPGDTVFVTDDTGAETRGRVADVTASALRLTVKGVEREWSATMVRRLERRGDSVRNGAVAGLVTGGIFGFLGLLGSGGTGGEAFPIVPSGGQIAVILGVFAGASAGIGAGIEGPSGISCVERVN